MHDLLLVIGWTVLAGAIALGCGLVYYQIHDRRHKRACLRRLDRELDFISDEETR